MVARAHTRHDVHLLAEFVVLGGAGASLAVMIEEAHPPEMWKGKGAGNDVCRGKQDRLYTL